MTAPAKLVFALIIVLASQVAVGADAAFEEAAALNAKKILPDELLKGPHHRVESEVLSDGYLNYYKIQSDYGEFDAVSTAGLKTRVGEIGALSALDELSKTEVFINAAAEAGVAQLKTLQAFATKPVETVKGIPGGIGRMFGRAKRQTSEAVDATKEFVSDDDEESDASENDESDSGSGATDAAVGLTEGYFGVGKAQRAWAQKLGTDPYSSNEVLQAAIKEVAWAERLGKFGMGFAGIPSIPGADIIGEVNNAVWSLDPWALEDLNRERLVATGASEDLIEIYLDNHRLTPSQQTLLTAAIAEMDGVEGQDGILKQSLRLDGETEVNFFIKSVTMLAWYHLNRKPLAKVLSYAVVPVGVDQEGGAALLFAVDHLYWTESIATAAANHAGRRAADREASVWLLGTASERSRKELGGLGFSVHEGVASMMLASAEED